MSHWRVGYGVRSNRDFLKRREVLTRKIDDVVAFISLIEDKNPRSLKRDVIVMS